MTRIEKLLRMYCEKGQEDALIADVIELKQHLGVRCLNILTKEFKDTTNY